MSLRAERLRKAIDSRIIELQKAHEREALEKLEKLAQELGLERAKLAAHFGSGSKGAVKNPVAPKDRNPANPIQTWAGRGKKPGWVQEHLQKGGSLEELAIGVP